MKPGIFSALTLTFLVWSAGGTIAQAANPDHVQRLLKTNQCPNCDLSNAELTDANLFGANLVNANLQGANLTGVNLGSANLTDANLSGAKLINAYLHLATFDGTNLNQADLSGSYLRGVLIRNTSLRGASLQRVNLSQTNLSGVNLQGVDLREANLNRTMLTGMIPGASTAGLGLLGTPSFSETYFRQTLCEAGATGNSPPPDDELERYGIALANLNGANLSGANLSEALLVAGDLRGTNLSQANLTKTCLGYAKLNNAILDGADLNNARLENAILEGASLKDVKNANLDKTFASEAIAQAGPIQTEARQYVGSMNRAEQAYYLEMGKFTGSIAELGIGIRPETENYLYRAFVKGKGNQSRVITAGIARKDGVKSYIGLVGVRQHSTGELLTQATLCESVQPTKLLPSREVLDRLTLQSPCPPGYKRL
jgi:uncharacterized protein YjbI with pentapeptide repeats